MTTTSPEQLTQSIKSIAIGQGFSQCGVAPAVSPTGFHRLLDWLKNEFHGEMSYMSNRADAYQHPDSVLEGVKSVVILAMDYATKEPEPTKPGHGRVARYAWGSADYHDLIKTRLRTFERRVHEIQPDVRLRTIVDTAPLLEREFAQIAGLGWFGKNTMLINPKRGSYFFLAGLLLDCELEYDKPFESTHSGSCTACLEACPTNAFPEAGVLDATKCISYLTIEHRSAVANPLRSNIGEWLFGCDVCQEVCPWNRFQQQAIEPDFRPQLDQADCCELFSMTDEQFRNTFRKTPMWRAKRRGLLRNSAIVLGNNPNDRALEALAIGLQDEESLVRGASAWAIGEIIQKSEHCDSISILETRQSIESDEEVKSEIAAAILRCSR